MLKHWLSIHIADTNKEIQHYHMKIHARSYEYVEKKHRNGIDVCKEY